MLNTIQFKQADIADAEEILRIQKSAFQSEAKLYANFKIPPLVQSSESIKADFSEFEFYKVLFENRIVGSVKVKLIDKHKLWVARLVVDPAYQNKGIGKYIMSELESEFTFVRIYELITGEKSKRNIQFYKASGYQITEYFREPEHEDILLVKMVKYCDRNTKA